MKVTVINNTRWGEKYGMVTLNAPEFVAKYRPGQLCMLSVNAFGQGDKSSVMASDPLLKRPFAPFSINVERGEAVIMYAIVGRGTEILSRQPKGAVLSLSMPHGNVYKLVKDKKTALIAGGVGLAPMHCLADSLHKNGCEVHIFYGGRTSYDLHPSIVDRPAPHKWYLATEDGSIGIKGFSTFLFEENIDDYDMCYTCGPMPMMHAVQKICHAHDKPLQVSLEANMACGTGVCYGCMVDTTKGMKRCCTEGPVFNGHDVVWK